MSRSNRIISGLFISLELLTVTLCGVSRYIMNDPIGIPMIALGGSLSMVAALLSCLWRIRARGE